MCLINLLREKCCKYIWCDFTELGINGPSNVLVVKQASPVLYNLVQLP